MREKMTNQRQSEEDGDIKRGRQDECKNKKGEERNEGFRCPTSEEPINVTNDFTSADRAHLYLYPLIKRRVYTHTHSA